MANKAQFTEAMSNRLGGDRKQATAAVDAFIDTVYEYVVKDPKGVTITGFGRFYKQPRAARMGRNPATGAPVRVKKTVAAKFSAGSELKKIASGEKKLAKAPAKKATPAKAAATKKVAPAKAAKSAAPRAARSAANGTATKTTATKAPTKRATASATKAAAKKAPAKKTAARKATASAR